MDQILKDPNLTWYAAGALVVVVIYWEKIKTWLSQKTDQSQLEQLTKLTVGQAKPVADKTINWQEAACYCRCLQKYLAEDSEAAKALSGVIWPAIGRKT